MTIPEIGVYIALTDGHGKVPLKLQLINIKNEQEPIHFAEGELTFEDPRSVAELAFHLSDISFQEAGEYRFQLFCGDVLLLERRILIMDSEDMKDE